MEEKIAHLGFIQGIINRMGNNSFLIKGWTVTLVAACFALSAKDTDPKYMFLALFPTIMFWLLDAFFLHQEKLYRELYKQVATEKIDSSEFTLDAASQEFGAYSYSKAVISKTLLPFYLIIILLIAICLLRAFKLI